MRTLNYGLISGVFAGSLLLAGCDSNDIFVTPGTTTATTNPGVVSQKNFSILAEDPTPTVIDPTSGLFTQTDIVMTVFIGDRNNQTISDKHRVYFETEYGLLNPTYCDTESNGSCSVTWSAIKRPEAGGPGSDFYVTITAYTAGEEAFTDSNGNSVFDNADAGFEDIEEPYVDADRTYANTRSFSSGDTIIDVVNTNDPTGVNGQHDIADGFFNGNGCTHSSLCAVRKSITIWEDNVLKINGPP